MFDSHGGPNVFGIAPGQDFPKSFTQGLFSRLAGVAPAELARVEIFVNTRRMQRRMRDILAQGDALLHPRIRLITDLTHDPRFPDIPPATSALRRRLDLTQLVSALLTQQPELAPRAALFDLSDSLAALLEEMEGEGVSPDAIRQIDVADQSGHWKRSLGFVDLVTKYVESENSLSAEGRLRRITEALDEEWQKTPPEHPILVVGSTGSRGASFELMRAVSRLPNGGIVLPGFDFDTPSDIWERMRDGMTSEDHPQYRYVRLDRALNIDAGEIRPWAATTGSAPRRKLISLALRPAPVTDQWAEEGARLGPLSDAVENLHLLEAPSPRLEAVSIAVALREAVDEGKVAALISPDRNLTRRVTAALDHWGIIPDDSGGQPLGLSPPGRFLRQISSLFHQKLTIEALIALLKHPLTNSSDGDRGPHLLNTQELELYLRRKGCVYPVASDLLTWAEKSEDARQGWCSWLVDCVLGQELARARSLSAHLEHHISLTERIAAGPESIGTGELWKKAAGEEALKVTRELQAEAAAGGNLTANEYAALFSSIMGRAEVRDAVLAHPRVLIWGTLEARVEGADLVVLGGLNEGIWPSASAPDPWLNRRMRTAVGLLLPERQIGLSAHDFQQAVCAKEVILSRSLRDDEAETVPSRWLNRISNLMRGLSSESAGAFEDMKARGSRYLRLAQALEDVENREAPAQRPAPRPPVEYRPKEISVTEVQRLIRDPYAVYARRVLGLDPLPPMRIGPDAPMRGTLIHRVLEKFTSCGPLESLEEGRARLLSIADDVFRQSAPWPATRAVWRQQLELVSNWFVAGEIERGLKGSPVSTESKGSLALGSSEVSLVGRPDRVDRLSNGAYAVYDYKTGKPSSKKQREHFDKQLPLTAALVNKGALEGVGAGPVSEVGYIALTRSPVFETIPLESGEIERVLQDLCSLLVAYQDPDKGYPSRRAIERREYLGDYDHLARFGEWDEADEPMAEDVGK